MTARLASAAFRLAMRRLYIFPLAPGTKIPVKGTHGCRGATRDLDVVRAWWQRWPNANVGIATGRASGVWVLDHDVPEGDATMARLEGEHGPLPVTIMSSTPSGGTHYYWRWPADIQIRNSCGRVGLGLDVLAEGGSVTLPPSTLSNGGRYRSVENGARGFADAPAWLVELALPPAPPPRPKPKPLSGNVDRYCSAAIASELQRLAAAEEGRRNVQLNRSAFSVAQFVAAGVVPEAWARQQLEEHAVGVGLTALEARRTIDSAFAAGLALPRELPR